MLGTRGLSLPLPAAGRALAEAFAFEAAGRPRDALERFQRATAIDPACGGLWRHRGNLLRKVGELGAAAECFARAIERGDDRVLNEFFLSAVGVGPVAPDAPAGFVAALFDQYAERFDEHLLRRLGYRAPAVLADLVRPSARCAFDSAIDLGCGTGLAGAAFRTRCRHLVGVDLSPRMLSHAERRGVYDALIRADLLTALAGRSACVDLVVCCDVLIYVGDLAPLFAAVAACLRDGGSFAFTVERGEAASGFDLLPSLRYQHSERYLRRQAETQGFCVRELEPGVLRVEDDEAVEGLYVHLVRAASAAGLQRSPERPRARAGA